MKKIQYHIALWGAKFTKLVLKITKHNATDFPGVVALKICPDFIKHIDKPQKIIGITGTNGKTTVTNIIVDMLHYNGVSCIENRLGSNTVTGIATSLINGCNIFGKCKYETGVFEIDERSSVKIYPHILPNYLIITNLSRDSIMRNGHPEYIAGILDKSIPKTTKLILNADDLISSNICKDNERAYFGISKMETDITECNNLINDLQICPKCHTKLNYEYLRYHHIGKAYCPHCGYCSPKYDFEGCTIDLATKTLTIKDKGSCGNYKLLNDSVFNIYNMVAVIALFREIGYSHNILARLLEKIKIVDSRYHTERIDDITITSQMAKDRNAFACSRVFDYIKQTPGDKEIIMMMLAPTRCKALVGKYMLVVRLRFRIFKRRQHQKYSGDRASCKGLLFTSSSGRSE